VIIRVRAFADDFSSAVARATSTRVAEDFRVSDEAAERYVLGALAFRVAGTPLPLRLLRQERDGEVTWLELQTERPISTLRGVQVSQRLLTEWHADQVNVIKAYYAGRQFTTVCSKDVQARQFP